MGHAFALLNLTVRLAQNMAWALCGPGPCSGQPDVKHRTVRYMWVVTLHNGTSVQLQPQTAATQTVRLSIPRY